MRWVRRAIVAAVALAALAVAALFAFRTPDTDPAAMRAKYADASSRFVDLGGGLVVHVRDTGPRGAPALVLIHGSNASLHTWQGWADRLDRRYRIVRLDLPGHGLTGEDATRDYRTARQVAIVDRLAATLGIPRFAIGGNSMGGGVAWNYALAHPDRATALILVDSVGQPDPGSTTPPLSMRIARLPVLRDLATMVTPRSWIEQALPSAYGDPALADGEAIDLYWELLRYPGNRLATIDRFATANPPATPEQLARIAVPTLILWGAEDQMIPVASGAWLARHIPGSRLVTYQGIGHLPMEEAPGPTAAEVDRFLAAIQPLPLRGGVGVGRVSLTETSLRGQAPPPPLP